jgi:hypothetical protein
MITRDDLKQRVYDGQDCVEFMLKFSDKDLGMETRCYFQRKMEEPTNWNFHCYVDDGMHEKRYYDFWYEVPSKSIKLELVAAAGLMRFNQILEQEVQAKQVLSTLIFGAVQGM